MGIGRGLLKKKQVKIEYMSKQILYIAHKISGDIPGNLNRIGEIYRLLSLQNEVIPFAPYIATLSCLDDNIPQERSIGFIHNKEFFKRKMFDAMGVFSATSPGVAQEIRWCEAYGIEVVDYTYWVKKYLEEVKL